MRNKIIENAIDSVVNASNTSSDFKLAFRQYVKNKFDDNAKESDLKRILTLIVADYGAIGFGKGELQGSDFSDIFIFELEDCHLHT